MPASINRVAGLMLVAFAVLAGALGYWFARGQELTARADNPRRILAERRILRGPILDRDGEVIAETVGERGAYQRHSLYPHAAPFTGYYSLNYGMSEIEEAFDATLRGTQDADPLQSQMDRLLHVSPVGRGVQTTIDLDIQRLADGLLAGHRGAIVVVSVPDGDILALSSLPTFDPNALDEDWDVLRADPGAPLLNRATQGQYQPGTALQPFVLLEAMRRGTAALDDIPASPRQSFGVGARTLDCATDQEVFTLADALRASCPVPFADLGPSIGADGLWSMVTQWGFDATSITGVETRPPLALTMLLSDTRRLREFAAGQGEVTLSPLQMAIAAQALAARGQLRSPRIVSATQAIDGAWRAASTQAVRQVARPDLVEQIIAALTRGEDYAFHVGVGLSGASTHRWLIGFTPIEDARYVIAVLIEQAPDADAPEDTAVRIGRQLLEALARRD